MRKVIFNNMLWRRKEEEVGEVKRTVNLLHGIMHGALVTRTNSLLFCAFRG